MPQAPKWDIIKRVASSHESNYRRILGLSPGNTNVKKAMGKTMLAVHPDRFHNRRAEELHRKVKKASDVLMQNPTMNTRGLPVIILPQNFNILQPKERNQASQERENIAERARKRVREQIEREKPPPPKRRSQPKRTYSPLRSPPPTQSQSFPTPKRTYSPPKQRSPSPSPNMPKRSRNQFYASAANTVRRASRATANTVRRYGPAAARKARNAGRIAFLLGLSAARRASRATANTVRRYGPAAARKARNAGYATGRGAFKVGTFAANRGKKTALKMYQLGQNYGPKLIAELVKISRSGKNKTNRVAKLVQKYGENRVIPAFKQKYRNVSGETALQNAIRKQRNAEMKYKSTQRNYMNLEQKIQNMSRNLSKRGRYTSNYMLPVVMELESEYRNLISRRNNMQKILRNNAKRLENSKQNVKILSI